MTAAVTKDTGDPDRITDRSPPIAYLLSAEAFLKTAVHAHQALAAKTLRLRFDMPVYYLYSHAVELTLKAFLRTTGLTAKELSTKRWGHDLARLWNGCFERGLDLDLPTRLTAGAVVGALAPYAANYEFRYVVTGSRELPTLDAVQEGATLLHHAIEPTIAATVAVPSPEPG